MGQVDEFIRHGVVSGLRQLLEFGLFHADPHAGNIFALEDGRIAYVDFGNVAEISEANKEVSVWCVCSFACLFVCVFVSICLYMRLYARMCVCVCVCVCMCVYACVFSKTFRTVCGLGSDRCGRARCE